MHTTPAERGHFRVSQYSVINSAVLLFYFVQSPLQSVNYKPRYVYLKCWWKYTIIYRSDRFFFVESWTLNFRFRFRVHRFRKQRNRSILTELPSVCCSLLSTGIHFLCLLRLYFVSMSYIYASWWVYGAARSTARYRLTSKYNNSQRTTRSVSN